MGRFGCGADSDVAFADFMSAFRKEMQESHERKDNMQRFVPSKVKAVATGGDTDRIGALDEIPSSQAMEAEEEDDAFEWPQELLTLGLGADNVEANFGSSTSTSTTTSTTTTSEDEWPEEMLL